MYTIYNKILSGQSKNTFLQVYPFSYFLSKSHHPLGPVTHPGLSTQSMATIRNPEAVTIPGAFAQGTPLLSRPSKVASSLNCQLYLHALYW